MHPDDWAMTAETLAKSLASGADFTSIIAFCGIDGAYRWFRSRSCRARLALGTYADGTGPPSMCTTTTSPSRHAARAEGELGQPRRNHSGPDLVGNA